ncbi:MAG: DNA repair protein RecN [Chitinophagaceae bacterium]
MLKNLSIQNYAIIDELEIEFSGGLNIITGETGAGKSIIMGALRLILGERADSAVLVNKTRKCFVEGCFVVTDKRQIKNFLEENDLDSSEDLVVRREIAVNGKSRAFINDTPVTLSQLNELSSLLVDLHQQFDTLNLAESDFQRQVLDALAANAEYIDQYQQLYTHWQQVIKQLQQLVLQKQQFEKEADYNRFQFAELEEAAFKENELEEIEAELKMLNNSEGIKAGLSKIVFELKENDLPVVQQLRILANQLQNFSDALPSVSSIVNRLHSAQVELQDIADETESLSEHINYDPEKIERLNDRLSLGYKLFKKHGVKTTNELLDIQKQLAEKLQAVLNIDEEIEQKKKLAETYFTEAKAVAEKISERRIKQVKPFEEKVNKLLAQVGMPNARLKTEVKIDEALNHYGNNSISFLFDANKSGRFQPLSKVASGGELSRLMLCIKSLVVQKIDLPTMIFDEIDTGISGEAARQVGMIMKELADKRQVICITHQPQIAGKAHRHLLVYKEIVNDKVNTSIRQLSVDERITTIAKMLSGEKPTAAALENAREMVMN